MRFLLSLLFFSILNICQAQLPCPDTTKHDEVFERIFGGDDLLIKGEKTLTLENGNQLNYSCFDCLISYRTQSGNTRWKRDLSSLNCRLQVFETYTAHKKKSAKPMVIVQLYDRRIYRLSLRNGRLKEMKYKTSTSGKKKNN